MVRHHLGHHPAHYKMIVRVPSLSTNVNHHVTFFLRKLQVSSGKIALPKKKPSGLVRSLGTIRFFCVLSFFYK